MRRIGLALFAMLLAVGATVFPLTTLVGGDDKPAKKGNLLKVLSWYDNEWGYSCRTVDLIAKFGAM